MVYRSCGSAPCSVNMSIVSFLTCDLVLFHLTSSTSDRLLSLTHSLNRATFKTWMNFPVSHWSNCDRLNNDTLTIFQSLVISLSAANQSALSGNFLDGSLGNTPIRFGASFLFVIILTVSRRWFRFDDNEREQEYELFWYELSGSGISY